MTDIAVLQRSICGLLVKAWPEGHDCGTKALVHGVGDVEMDLAYRGLRRSPTETVATVIQADVDVKHASPARCASVSRFTVLD